MDYVTVNGHQLDSVPVEAGNLWQRCTFNMMSHEYGPDVRQHPVSHLLVSRYMPAGRSVTIDSLIRLDRVYEQIVRDNAMEITSANLAGTVSKIEAWLTAADESHLIEAIVLLDYVLADALLNAGVVHSQKSLIALVSVYKSYKTTQTKPRRELLRVLLQVIDPCAIIAGKPLLHHLCVGAASAQDIQVLLNAGAWQAINDRDDNGDTPLHCYLAYHTKPSLSGLTRLLEGGADATLVDGERRTALQILHARNNLSAPLGELLVNYGCPEGSDHPPQAGRNSE